MTSPSRITVVTEVKRIDGRGFYPTKCQIDFREYDSKPEKTKELGLARKADDCYTRRTWRWEVRKVRTRQEMSAEMFRLWFPDGTRYHDTEKKRIFNADKSPADRE